MKILKGLLAGSSLGLLSLTVQAATTADVVFVVDESGSMAGEHAWIAGMVGSLDAELAAAGVTGNRYALVGFGAAGGHAAPSGIAGHVHALPGGSWGTAAELSAATGSLVISGATEDGYSGINTALGLAFRGDAAANIVLITDEDRDAFEPALTAAGILAGLDSKNALLNAVVNASFNGGAALGHDSDGNAYIQSGTGYTTAAAGAVSGAGTTKADYIDIALATGGAAWDLNKLRAGGDTATAFTAAFVDIKVQEIIVQPPVQSTPDGGATFGLLGLGLSGMWLVSRVRARA